MNGATERHLDEETLALLALGEDVMDAAARVHLDRCARCAAELASLRDVVAAGRGGGPLEAPPVAVWDRIAAEVGGVDSHTPSDRITSGRPAEGTPPPRLTVVTPDGGTGAQPVGPGWRGRRPLLAAAAGLVIGIGGTLLVQGLENRPSAEVISRAQLEPLPGWSQTGSAEVEEVGGEKLLHVQLAGKPPEGYREVWLIDQQVKRLVSVGVLAADQGTFQLPPGLDIRQFPYVDVSAEPYDGNPAHSTDSIARGRLT